MQIIQDGEQFKISVQVDREAAILAGKSRHGKVVVTLDPSELSPEHREALVQAGRRGPRQDKDPIELWCRSVKVPDASLESIKLLLDGMLQVQVDEAEAQKAEEAAHLATHMAKFREFLALPDPECIEVLYGDWARSQTVRYRLVGSSTVDWRNTDLADEIRAKLARLDQEIERRNQEERAKRQENAARMAEESKRKQEVKEAKEKMQRAQITSWVNQHGNENQMARMAAGVLPDDEIVGEIRDATFRVLDSYPRYQKMTSRDVCTCDYSPCKVNFSVEDATTMTALQWSMAQEIRKLLPAATVTLRVHEGAGDACESSLTRHSYLVVLEVGGFSFSREYGAPEE